MLEKVDLLELYVPSTAASKERIVSRGRSMRRREGFDRSGSSVGQRYQSTLQPGNGFQHTDVVSVTVLPFHFSNVAKV